MNRKEKFITAYAWAFGGTKQKAEKVYKTAGNDEYRIDETGYIMLKI